MRLLIRKEAVMFYPFLNYFNRGRVRTVDNFGIPVLRTNYVTTDTTTTSVTYGEFNAVTWGS